MDLTKIEGLVLSNGSHASIEGGACLMEAVSYCMGESFTDFPSCTPREVSRLAQRINDGYWKSNAERTEVLTPLIPMLASCERSDAASRLRAFLCADRGRLWAADAIEIRGFAGHAETVRAIPTIVDKASAEAARDTIRSVRNELTAAAYYYAAAAAAADAAAAYYAAAAADAAAAYYAAAAAAAADARIKCRSERIELLIAMCQVRVDAELAERTVDATDVG